MECYYKFIAICIYTIIYITISYGIVIYHHLPWWVIMNKCSSCMGMQPFSPLLNVCAFKILSSCNSKSQRFSTSFVRYFACHHNSVRVLIPISVRSSSSLAHSKFQVWIVLTKWKSEINKLCSDYLETTNRLQKWDVGCSLLHFRTIKNGSWRKIWPASLYLRS